MADAMQFDWPSMNDPTADFLTRYRQREQEVARGNFISGEAKSWTDQMLEKLRAAQTPDEQKQIETLIRQGERAYGMMRSTDPELRRIGAGLMGDVFAADRNYDQQREAIHIDQVAAAKTLAMQFAAQQQQRQMAMGNEINGRYERVWTDIQKESAPFITMRNTFTQIKAAAQDPSGASDVALVKLFSKLTDPTTGVLQGEADSVAGLPSGGVAGLLTLAYKQTRNGEFLLPYQRAQLLDTSAKLYASMADVQEVKNVEYLKRAVAQGIPQNYLQTIPIDTFSQGQMPNMGSLKAPPAGESPQSVLQDTAAGIGDMYSAARAKATDVLESAAGVRKAVQDLYSEDQRKASEEAARKSARDALRRGTIERPAAAEAKAEDTSRIISQLDDAAAREAQNFRNFSRSRSGRK